MEQPRVGVVGCGTIGRTHLDAYRANGVSPVALADSSAEALRAAVEAYGGRGYADYGDLLRSGEVDAVSICTPPSSHRDIAVAALGAGVAVLCEKPMTTTVEDAEAMAAAARGSSAFLTVGFCHRFQPQIERLRELAGNGDLGAVLMFRNRFAGHLKNVEKTWFAQPALSGGGVLMDTCVHSVDLFRFLVGDPARVDAVVATTESALGPALSVEDTGVILLRTATGVLGTIEASWRTPPGEWVVTVYGTNGTAEVDYDTGELRIRTTGNPAWQTVDVPPGDRFHREIAHFLACVAGDTTPRVTVEDGVAAVRILAAAYASAANGES